MSMFGPINFTESSITLNKERFSNEYRRYIIEMLYSTYIKRNAFKKIKRN